LTRTGSDLLLAALVALAGCAAPAAERLRANADARADNYARILGGGAP
jgi:hypothetical protein